MNDFTFEICKNSQEKSYTPQEWNEKGSCEENIYNKLRGNVRGIFKNWTFCEHFDKYNIISVNG